MGVAQGGLGTRARPAVGVGMSGTSVPTSRQGDVYYIGYKERETHVYMYIVYTPVHTVKEKRYCVHAAIHVS